MADTKRNELDSILNAALAKYAAIEPRAGLEDRILANLQARQARVPDRVWWRWGVTGALAAVVVMVFALAWRSGKLSPPFVANHSSAAKQGHQEPATKATVHDERNEVGTPMRITKAAAHRQHLAVAASNPPKLERFPSPQPLSEQEKMLQSYVAKYPEHAVLVARALTHAVTPDQLKGIQAFPVHTGAMDSEEPNDDTTER